MKTSVFNVYPEVGPRVLILLSCWKKPLRINQVALIDLLSTFGKKYGLRESNLHGNNESSGREIAARRKVIQRSMTILAGQGYVKVVVSQKGFSYLISDSGKSEAAKLKDLYSLEYRSACSSLIQKFGSYDESEMFQEFNKLIMEGYNDGHN